MLILGSSHPYEIIGRNYTSILSEFVIVIIMDTLMISSDPAIDPQSHQTIGWLIIGVMGISIIFSQGSLLVSSVKDMIKSYKLKKIRKAN